MRIDLWVQILSPWLGDIVDYGILMSYLLASVAWQAGTATLCQSRLYPPIRDPKKFGIRSNTASNRFHMSLHFRSPCRYIVKTTFVLTFLRKPECWREEAGDRWVQPPWAGSAFCFRLAQAWLRKYKCFQIWLCSFYFFSILFFLLKTCKNVNFWSLLSWIMYMYI